MRLRLPHHCVPAHLLFDLQSVFNIPDEIYVGGVAKQLQHPDGVSGDLTTLQGCLTEVYYNGRSLGAKFAAESLSVLPGCHGSPQVLTQKSVKKKKFRIPWVFSLISPAHLHVRLMGRTCR